MQHAWIHLRPEVFYCVKLGDETQVLCPAFALVIFEIPQRPSVQTKTGWMDWRPLTTQLYCWNLAGGVCIYLLSSWSLIHVLACTFLRVMHWKRNRISQSISDVWEWYALWQRSTQHWYDLCDLYATATEDRSLYTPVHHRATRYVDKESKAQSITADNHSWRHRITVNPGSRHEPQRHPPIVCERCHYSFNSS